MFVLDEFCYDCICYKCKLKYTSKCLDTCDLCKYEKVSFPNDYCTNDDVINSTGGF